MYTLSMEKKKTRLVRLIELMEAADSFNQRTDALACLWFYCEPDQLNQKLYRSCKSSFDQSAPWLSGPNTLYTRPWTHELQARFEVFMHNYNELLTLGDLPGSNIRVVDPWGGPVGHILRTNELMVMLEINPTELCYKYQSRLDQLWKTFDVTSSDRLDNKYWKMLTEELIKILCIMSPAFNLRSVEMKLQEIDMLLCPRVSCPGYNEAFLSHMGKITKLTPVLAASILCATLYLVKTKRLVYRDSSIVEIASASKSLCSQLGLTCQTA